VCTGVYRITRNPMYVGMMLGLLSWAVCLASPLSLAGPVAFIAYITRFQIKPEEQALSARFGADVRAVQGQGPAMDLMPAASCKPFNRAASTGHKRPPTPHNGSAPCPRPPAN
jgi:hypothetical protein